MGVKNLQISGGFAVLSLVAVLCFPVSGNLHAEGFSDYGAESFAEMEQRRGLPVRGTTTKAVLAEFGEPVSRKGPVGNPPISAWHYENFDVYFEHQLVITSIDKEDALPTELKNIQ